MRKQCLPHVVAALALTLWCSFVSLRVRADDTDLKDDPGSLQKKHQFFENKVRPILVAQCLSCHSEEKKKGGLRLDRLAFGLVGGESGPAIVMGKPAESLLVEAIRYESLEMPPDKKLSDADIETLTQWIAIGAPWPGPEGSTSIEGMNEVSGSDSNTSAYPKLRGKRDEITEEDRNWWAFAPVKDFPPPKVPSLGDSTVSPIDAFILECQLREGLTPSPEADRLSLIKRLSLDLTGLPPTFAQVQQFVQDNASDAYERLVDRLLESKSYGERWARHWLDLVRYADSDGYRIDHYRPNAWRYRNYVIDSFNADKPYDRFVQEQVAGDELFPDSSEARIATGYLRHWIYEYNNRDVKTQWTTILNDITDTTGDVFLGMGMQCAKCHNHKFDPILQKDYFQLQAFFAPLIPTDAVVATDEQRRIHSEDLAKWESDNADLLQPIEEIEAPLREKGRQEALTKFPQDVQDMYLKPDADKTPLEKQWSELVVRQIHFEYDRIESKATGENKEKLLALKKQLSQRKPVRPSSLPVANTVQDVGHQAPQVYLPKRSESPVEPGFLTVLSPNLATISSDELRGTSSTTGRRAALAKWMTRNDNPLTTRVIVNRVWQYHFGKGLAPNSSDFGMLGGPPSHPELLDWLTKRFIEDGWSLKKLHKRILMSATYRQSTLHPEFASCSEKDPQNRFYWRSDTRRLDAEQVRDAVLKVSGELVEDPVEEGVLPDVPRRSIYTRVMRNARNALLDVFDLPLFFSSESARNTTTTPLQSLLLFHSNEMLRYAQSFAEKAWDSSSSAPGRVDAAWKRIYGRPPTSDELRDAIAFLDNQRQKLENLDAFKPTDVVTGRIPYRDGQAIAVSDEVRNQVMKIDNDDRLSVGDFTIEAFVQVRSVFETGQVRTIASKWNGKAKTPGWSFGVSGKGSRRKPQTLVLQMWGKKADGTLAEAAIFSDQNIELNKPYFVSAAVRMQGEMPGSVTFSLKDLSNDDEQLQSVTIPHEIVGGLENAEPLVIGNRSGESNSTFDGLIDDVRLSRSALDEAQLLFTVEAIADKTIGFWRFESEPGTLRDTSANQLHIQGRRSLGRNEDPDFVALTDLCHVLMNSNEFLYTK